MRQLQRPYSIEKYEIEGTSLRIGFDIYSLKLEYTRSSSAMKASSARSCDMRSDVSD